MRHVIIGSGPAGVIAAETLRQADPDGNVTLIGGEPGPPYGRMAIPYVLSGAIPEEGTRLRKDDGHYDKLGIAYVQGRAESVSVDGRLTLEGGETVAFDRLLVATGSSPVMPDVPGLDGDGVHHCWTLEDARAIAALAKPGNQVVLMGAGFIGCIVMEALAARGVKLTVVEIAERMLGPMMSDTGASMIKRWCEDKGIRVLTSTKAAAIERDGAMKMVLDNGDKLNADLVVVAAGVRPNMGFLEGSGVQTDRGIVVDEYLRTSAENIHAAGDVAQGPDFSNGVNRVHAIQPTAAEHGRIAALNMAGRAAPYKGSLMMNVLDTMGLVSYSYGDWNGGDACEAVDGGNFKYLRLAFDGDRLKGVLGIGLPQQVGALRGLIQGKVALGDWKNRLIDDPHLAVQAYVAQTIP